MGNIKFLLLGTFFGLILTKSQVISWFRIQEMFRFQSFYMYGVIGTAILVGFISIQLIKRYQVKAFSGQLIAIPPKELNKGTLLGGIIFGLGWAVTGACPGPIFALIGNGFSVISLTLISAIAGTWVYGFLKNKLPH
ncbi:MAG: DUF6691 family protein [Candidatus Cyclobacteriaceae bacterium M3_2C_046]